jgi:hypothetical protein
VLTQLVGVVTTGGGHTPALTPEEEELLELEDELPLEELDEELLELLDDEPLDDELLDDELPEELPDEELLEALLVGATEESEELLPPHAASVASAANNAARAHARLKCIARFMPPVKARHNAASMELRHIARNRRASIAGCR